MDQGLWTGENAQRVISPQFWRLPILRNQKKVETIEGSHLESQTRARVGFPDKAFLPKNRRSPLKKGLVSVVELEQFFQKRLTDLKVGIGDILQGGKGLVLFFFLQHVEFFFDIVVKDDR